jgi:hypothetical protein
MDLKKLDIKTIAIIVLGIALIISFMFGQKSHIDNHEDEIKALNKDNARLSHKDDSLNAINVKLDAAVAVINKVLEINIKKLSDTQLELDELKKKQNEVHTYVNHLSANGVTNAFTDYFQARTESSVSR